ncbi:rho guanine nucleotide exchange factor 11-like isoform X5 [Bolinopsis microptera]|uniref:rho guanine nucleotide exchange factor 11-like isoform X5 n=1 Tax=Bolinopsis microptera TaxID=2820187 RepID=UPI0030796A89
MTNVYDMSPDASDDEDFQTLAIEEFEPFKDLQTLLNRPAHLSIFLNYAIGENRPNNLLFILCVHHYQRQEKYKDIRRAASGIFEDFLNPSAVLRVSFPPEILTEISLGLHREKDPLKLQNIYNKALQLATKQVNVMINEFKNRLDMGLGNAYNVQALSGLDTFEDEKRVAKQILIDKFEELMKDTNDLHEEKNKALIAAVQYVLEDIGVLHGSSNIARSFSMNKRDVDKIAKKLHSLRNKETSKPVTRGAHSLKGLPSLSNPLGHKQRDPLSPGLESDGSRDNLSPSGYSDSTSNSTSHEHVDQLETQHNNNRFIIFRLPTDTPVKRWKSLPKDHSVVPKRPTEGINRPKSAAEESEMFKCMSLDGKQVFAMKTIRHDILKRPSSEDMSSNSSDGSNRSPFLDPNSVNRRESRNVNLIEFEHDPDLDIPDDMVLWSQTHSQLIKTRNMSKKQIQRQDVIHEFVHTEQHYVRKLKVLNVVYYNPLQQHDIIEKVQILWLFPNLDELINIHKEFCNKLLERQRSQNPVMEVTDIIKAHLSRYDLKEACAKFCNHQKSALAMFKNIYQNSADLKNFCYQAEMHSVTKRLDLDQLIGSVLHRITKYPLLLGELKKCTKDENNPDFAKLSENIKLAKDLACFVNLRIRETENANRLERLQKSIDNQIPEEMKGMGHLHNMRINAPHRKLMFDGTLTLMIDKDHSLEVLGLLMTDCLVLLLKQDARYLLKPLSHDLSPNPPKAPVIMLQDMHLSAIDKREKRFIIANKNPKTPDLYELRCSNKDQKETWNTSIKVAKEQFSTGKLKHLSDQVFPQQQHHPKLPSLGSMSKTDSEHEESSGESEEESDESETESEGESESEDNTKIDTTLDDPEPATPTVISPLTRAESETSRDMTPQPPTRSNTAPSRQYTAPERQSAAPSSRQPTLPSRQTAPPPSRPVNTPPRQINAPSSRQNTAPPARQTAAAPPVRQTAAAPSSRQTAAPLSRQSNIPSRQANVSARQFQYQTDRTNMASATNNSTEEERVDNPKVDNLTEQTSQDLILRAMNETRNIERLALSIGKDRAEDPELKMKVQRSAAMLNKSLKQLMTTAIADSQTLINLEAHKSQSEARISMLESLLDEHGIAYG